MKKKRVVETLNITEQLEQDCGQLLTIVKPRIKLQDLSIGSLYLLPADVGNSVLRLLLEIKGEFCILKNICSDKEQQKNNFAFYEVHYSWLRQYSYATKK